MGIHYENLDVSTRSFMLEESALGDHYISPRLTEEGQAQWRNILEEGIKDHNDDWIAGEILHRGYMRMQEQCSRKGVPYTRKINREHAAQQLAEGEFNRYYIRGLCLRAKSTGADSLVVYRGKAVRTPRPESEAKIGTLISVDVLLSALRSNDFVTIEAAIGVPGGPNSGLTCRLP